MGGPTVTQFFCKPDVLEELDPLLILSGGILVSLEIDVIRNRQSE